MCFFVQYAICQFVYFPAGHLRFYETCWPLLAFELAAPPRRFSELPSNFN
ncbi:hypothetical protein DAPPUDRAFT_305804 [Daphnia pulex]|uniref:Uncharacterized protein n=1 Tax=Daphnia pulex TaxID=6669 RepID=E9GSR1_DAPPU|nr:hypothetical protein DAPPUDRAFT_305804 [Daphnia pulex]|eukprot:EFX77536.1 hypothetical protein DAPPUDRAFT_305804 [Daphnia pulex]